jgi:hypothetical protein
MTEPTEDFAGLPREAEAPRGLEDATVEALVARGLLRRPPARRPRAPVPALALAASVLLFLGGVAVGRRGEPALPPAPPGQFALLLYEGPGYRHSAPGEEAERVREYGAWAAARAEQGELVAGEKLREDPDVVVGSDGTVSTPAPPAGADRLAGFFLIRAADARRAVEIARSCPHVRYGGSIVIREIEPT